MSIRTSSGGDDVIPVDSAAPNIEHQNVSNRPKPAGKALADTSACISNAFLISNQSERIEFRTIRSAEIHSCEHCADHTIHNTDLLSNAPATEKTSPYRHGKSTEAYTLECRSCHIAACASHRTAHSFKSAHIMCPFS